MTEYQQRLQAEAEAMAEMHRAGKKNREIAEAFGCDHPTIDHVVPLSKGGGHTWENVRVACGRCNADKRDIILKGDRGQHG